MTLYFLFLAAIMSGFGLGALWGYNRAWREIGKYIKKHRLRRTA